MADSLREQIMQALVTDLTGLATTGSSVTRDQAYNLNDSDLPHISIFQGDDIALNPDGDEGNTFTRMDMTLNVRVEIRVNGNSNDFISQINQIHKEIVIALQAGSVHSIGQVLFVSEISSSAPDIDTAGDKRLAQSDIDFEIHYRRLKADPSQ